MFNLELFRKANDKIIDVFLLCNTVTQRVRQLREGADPLVDYDDESYEDLALMEIAEGKIEARKEEITTGQDLFGKVE